MTIQLSVLIWTVICFCVFMLVLDRLLFKPLLRFMDRRKEKMECADLLEKQRMRQEAAARLEAEAAEKRQLEAQEFRKNQERLKTEYDERLRALASSLENDAVTKRAEFEAEAARMEEAVSASLDGHLAAYLDKLASYGEL